MNISKQATINIGTIGHVAHGKSTLVKAISGVVTTKHSKEMEKNITIQLGYANAKIYKCDMCPSPICYKTFGSKQSDLIKCTNDGCESYLRLVRHISFVDCPGHEYLTATMLTGTSVMDAVLLIIAGNETCPQPQTIEHLAAIELMKLKKLIIVQNKVDLINEQQATENYIQILKFIRGTVAEGSPIIPISAQYGYNIDLLCEHIVNHVPVPVRNLNINPQMMIIRSFDINKPGTFIKDIKGGIAGGSITQGIFKIGDKIEIKPGIIIQESPGIFRVETIYSTIETVFAETNQLEYAIPGGLIGMGTNIDPSICRSDRLVGHLIGLEDQLPKVFIEIEITFCLLNKLLGAKDNNEKIDKLSKGESLLINVSSSSVGGTIIAINKDLAILQLSKPICCAENDKISISRRIDRVWRLIGWGLILHGTKII